MDEVDGIILQSLKEIGCNLEDDARLKTLTPEEIFKCVGRLCKCIKPEIEISSHLPVQMAQRFTAASQLVDSCKSLGYNGDLGYQTILYSNPIELRRIFMWLIEHIPKSEDKVDSFHSTGDDSEAKSTESKVLRQLRLDMLRPWKLEFLQQPPNLKLDSIEDLDVSIEKPDESKLSFYMNIIDFSSFSPLSDVFEYKRKFQPSIFHRGVNLMPSVITTHDKTLMKKQSFSCSDVAEKLRSSANRSIQSLNLTSSPSIASLSTKSKANEKSQQDVPRPKTRLEILAEKIEELKEQIQEQEDLYRQLNIDKNDQRKSIEKGKEELEVMKKSKKLKMQVAMLLDNPEESIMKLKQSLDVANTRREKLNSKFESHKQPLEVQLESFSGTNSIKLQKAEEKANRIKNVRKNIQDIQVDLKNKLQMQQQLQTELSQMKRVTERSAYTSRIIDIVKSIKKQNNDINEILRDTKALQKSINTVEGQLQRQFLASEDLIWNNVRR